MSDIDVNQLLNQMRVMAQASQGAHTSGNPVQANPEAKGPDFAALLKQSVDSVNTSQQQAGAMRDAFVAGDPNTQLPDVMIALEKASLSFEAMKQVRNKLVEAYQSVMSQSL